jgi:hypothetical protein
MTKIERDYSHTIIYKIYCNDINVTDVYVGHTINFIQRKNAHKLCSECLTHHEKLYKTIRANGGWNNWTMDCVATYKLKNLAEAREMEQKHFEQLQATLNSVPPCANKIPTIIPKNILNTNNNNISTPKISHVPIPVLIPVSEVVYLDGGKFKCVNCEKIFSNKSNYTKHLSTVRHKMNVLNKNSSNSSTICNICSKQYLSRNGLWKHKKTCVISNKNTSNPINNNDFYSELIKQHNEFKSIILEQNIKITDILQQTLLAKGKETV